ncbi:MULTISPECIES: universal stress protein [Rhodobacterales]|jgi:nucleotide-binding universal stress UspA family protein|uniref:Nucleotide-binding universal stress protein, UspA family n=1 Tax=Lentibacter algarum TaxID=576131 RepID=A0A1H3NF23_9RHOB|nr:universal stress protein [Lentibacter algarum]MCO4777074.1 universal stress protein [Lentibacter algarum]WIF32568.1 universal stress protein [Lentibacter algarum]SDY87517.1 Nucleotide-binding universal stress protein, UspA family [Lentibacter algarum]
MYKKILVPMALDHDISPRTLAIAQALAGDTGTITALHVYEAPKGSVNAYLDEEAKKDGIARAKSELLAKTEHLSNVQPVMVIGHTYRTIIAYARDNAIDCIVMGSHRPGFSDYLLGSTAARVVRHAPCAVHVQRSD